MNGDRFEGLLYRALNPVYARAPLSGRGAAIYGGRFNPKGTEALYTSLAPLSAIRDANQVGSLQPTTLVAYRADIGPVFDARKPSLLAEWDMDDATLADDAWRDVMRERKDGAPTQRFASRLIAAGFAALLVRSFAKGAGPDDLNLVIWRWNVEAGDRLEVIDDEDRLSRAP